MKSNREVESRVYDFQNRHLNFFFSGVGTSEAEGRGLGIVCLASSSESGGVGSPDVEEVGSSGFVIMLSFDLRKALPDDVLSDVD